MVVSFYFTLLGITFALLIAKNRRLTKEVERLYQLEHELFLRECEAAALSYPINDAIKEADENDRR